MEFKHFCENCGSHSSYQMPKVERLREKTFVERNNDLCSAPYLAGVLGVPEHPRNLGVQERGEA